MININEVREKMEIYDIVIKLIGPIYPAGAEHIDEKRYNNLIVMINLAEKILDDIREVATNKDKVEYSLNKAGKAAQLFLDEQKGYNE